MLREHLYNHWAIDIRGISSCPFELTRKDRKLTAGTILIGYADGVTHSYDAYTSFNEKEYMDFVRKSLKGKGSKNGNYRTE